MFIPLDVSNQIKIMDQLVPLPAPVVTSSVVPPLLGAELREPGARMSAQSAVTVCTDSLLFKVTLRVYLSCHLFKSHIPIPYTIE